jgi:hypothetical protein
MPLIKHPHFEINDLVTGQHLRNDTLFEGKIVYIFKKFEIPSRKKLLKYYGIEVMNPKYGRLFGPMFEDRVVIKQYKDGKKSYLILTMAGYNRYFTLHKITNLGA